MNRDNIAVLDAKVMPHNTVDASTSVIQIIIGQHNQHGVLALLSLDQNGITPEKLEGIHGVVGESNDGVIIVDGIGNAVSVRAAGQGDDGRRLHQRVGLLLLLQNSCRGIQFLILSVL